MLLIPITLDSETNNFKSKLEKEKGQLINKLLTGDLLGFEKDLFCLVSGFYDELCTTILNAVSTSPEMKSALLQFGGRNGLGKLEAREASLQLRTGTTIKIQGHYAKESKFKSYKGARHLSMSYWGCLKNATPMYYSQVSIMSVLCPSFEVSKALLDKLNIKAAYNRIRALSEQLGTNCLEDRVGNILDENESLAGKRVVISVDGGRTRVRDNIEGTGAYPKYGTPWKEPKLLVISTIGGDGKTPKGVLPIYDSVLGNCDKCFELMAKYLRKLEIEKAREVQFVADGATWIWNRAKQMLLGLGVEKEKVTETVDYYHAVEHLTGLVDSFPAKVKREQGAKLFVKFKQYLWNGETWKIIDAVKNMKVRATKKVMGKLTYFLKNEKRMRYGCFRAKKQLCGSGIVESAIRRVINMRFKCPSSFWDIKNLEPLIYLRSALLSNRWDILIKNFTLTWHKY